MKSFNTKKLGVSIYRNGRAISPTLLTSHSAQKNWSGRLINNVAKNLRHKKIRRNLRAAFSGAFLIFLAITIVLQMTASAAWSTVNVTDWSGIDPANVDNLITGTVGELTIGTRENSADWCNTANCNSDFPYRKTVTISNTGDPVTNATVKITVKQDANMRSDFGDVRFTTTDGNDLTHYLYKGIVGTTQEFIIILPKLYSNNQNIYMYFGNSVSVFGSRGYDINSISVGKNHTCIIASNDRTYCWGSGINGQLGNNNTESIVTPAAVYTSGALAGKTIKSITTGDIHTCAIASENGSDNAYCWGDNTYGQLGNNSTTQSNVPVAVNTDGVLAGKTIKSISAGGFSTCVVASNDQAYCWGHNFYGQLGNNSTAQSNVPVAVNTDGVLAGKTIKSITTGNGHTCAIASENGSDNAYCWGDNTYGQLGNNSSTTRSNVPVAVNTDGVLAGKTIKSITTGYGHTCAIASDNQAYCWGMSSHGQLGNNQTNGNYSIPMAVNNNGSLAGKTIKSISARGNYTCAVASDDQAYCWGYNSSGVLGDGSNSQRNVPVAVNTVGALAGKTIVSIIGGYTHTCAIDSDHQAYCWGFNNIGVLGNSNTEQSNVPVAVNTLPVILAGKSLKSIIAGSTRTCAIDSFDQAYCLGNNALGELGDGTYTQRFVPVPIYTDGVLTGKTIKSISTGSTHTCAIASENGSDNAYCWGDNTYGQLGNNSTTQSNVPVAVNTDGVLAGKTIKSISAGGFSTCVVASNDQAYCWGHNTHGQLGNNSTAQSNVPVAVNTDGVLAGKTIKSISAGGNHTCAIASSTNDLAYCWGSNSDGQLGNSSYTSSSVPVAVNILGVLADKTVKSISLGDIHTCAIASSTNDLAYCWGSNYYGQLGNNSSTRSNIPVAVNTAGVLADKTIKSIDAGGYSNCVIGYKTNDQAYCWGHNNYGQLGNNSKSNGYVPVAVSTNGKLANKTIKSISAGNGHACAVASDDQAYCWGSNNNGALSYNKVEDNTTPVALFTSQSYWLGTSQISNSKDLLGLTQYIAGKNGSLTSNSLEVAPANIFLGKLLIGPDPSNDTKIMLQIRSNTISDMTLANDWTSCNLISADEDIYNSNCIKLGDRFIQYKVFMSADSGDSLKIEDIDFQYNIDSTDPVLPNESAITLKTSQTGRTITNNQWSNSVLPYVSWSAATDIDGSGVAGYCLYYGEDDTPDFSSTSGYLMDSTNQMPNASNLCQYATANTNIDLSDIISPTSVSSINPGTKLNLFVRPFDYALNFTSTDMSTSFLLDLISPENNTYFNGPTGIANSKKFDIYWVNKPENNTSPYDAHSGAYGFKYCVIRLSEGNFDDCDSVDDPYWTGPSGTPGAINDSNFNDVYKISDGKITTNINDPNIDTNGTNVLMFALIDNAGNYDIDGNGAMSIVTVSQQSASIPTNLSAIPDPVDPLSNNYSFSWDPPAVYQGPSADINYCWTVNDIVKSDGSNCHWTGNGILSLSAGAYATQQGNNTLYLMAKDQAGNFDANEVAEVIFKTDTVAPGIPEYVSVVDVSTKLNSDWKLALSWAKPTVGYENISTYRIYRSIDGITFGSEPVGQTSSTTFNYTDSGLTQQTYYYKVLACDNASSCSIDSTIVSAFPTGKFTSPASLVVGSDGVKDISTKKATIYWITDRDSDSNVFIGTSPNVDTSGNYAGGSSTQLTNHSVDISNLQPGTKYYFKTKWTDIDDNFDYSSEQSFTTLPAPSISEVTVDQMAIDGGTVNFTIKNATKVIIYYGRTELFGSAKSINTSSAISTYAIGLANLDDGTKYYYKINGFDSDNNEYQGNTYSFTTLPRPRISNLRFQPVTNTALSNPIGSEIGNVQVANSTTGNSTKVTWTTNVPTTSELIYGPTGQPRTETINSDLVTEHDVTIAGLEDNKDYTLVARSRDDLGNIALSDTQSFKTALDTRPPVISNISSEISSTELGSAGKSQVIVSWETDELSTSQVEYGIGSGTSYESKSQENTVLTKSHVIVLVGLRPSSAYHFRTISSDASGNKAISETQSVLTEQSRSSYFDILIQSLQSSIGWLFGGNE